MAGHIAVLWMIAALGCLDPLTGKGPGATGVSPVGVLGSETVPQGTADPDMPTARPPVPFLRHPRPTSAAPLPEALEPAEAESQDALDMEAAKAAIERDGYKRIMMLGKAGNGAWHAKAYRGVAAVYLTVGSDGTVSAE